MQPDAALRYLPIADHLRQTLDRNAVICDVGSAGSGLGSYLRSRLLAVDIDIGGLRAAHKQGRAACHATVGSVTAMPFCDRAFDAVVAVDMIEHLRPDDRAQAIEEMIRCAREQVIVAVPCGERAASAEARIAAAFRRHHHRGHRWLAEHAAHGLPADGDIERIIARALTAQGRRAAAVTARDNTGLATWLAIQRLNISRVGLAAWLVGRPLSAILRPLLRRLADCPEGCGYRRIFYVDLSEEWYYDR